MIQTDKGETVMSGSGLILMAEISVITNSFIEMMTKDGMPRDTAVEMVKQSVEAGCLTDEERRAQVDKAVEHMSFDEIDEAFEFAKKSMGE